MIKNVVLLEIYHYHHLCQRKKTHNNSSTNGCMTSALIFHQRAMKNIAHVPTLRKSSKLNIKCYHSHIFLLDTSGAIFLHRVQHFANMGDKQDKDDMTSLFLDIANTITGTITATAPTATVSDTPTTPSLEGVSSQYDGYCFGK
jgi:hypothetical protein